MNGISALSKETPESSLPHPAMKDTRRRLASASLDAGSHQSLTSLAPRSQPSGLLKCDK